VAKIREIVVPKEDAVFWMDANGRWQNRHGPFEHAKIIDYFHSSIRKDEEGYHLYQEKEDARERVYFEYEDTPLFVFDVVIDRDITLILNTKKQMLLEPDKLVVRNDQLYVEDGEERIKFAERGLMKISECLREEADHYAIQVNGKVHQIRAAD